MYCCLFLFVVRGFFVRIPTLKNQENVVLAPMPWLTLLGFGCPLWVGATTNAPNFQGHPLLGATGQVVWHASCPKTAKNRQNAGVQKNHQLQGLSLKKLLAQAKGMGNWPGTLPGTPWQGFGGQGQCSKPRGLLGGCHLDLCILGGWAAFHGNFLLWAASMPPCQCACPQSWVCPKVCSLGW